MSHYPPATLVETRLEAAVREAMARGQTGFKGPAPSLFGQQVLSVVMPAQDESVPWIITLCAQQYASGSLPVTPLLPPSNTVQTGFNLGTASPAGQPPESFAASGGGFALGGPYVKVYWGLGNATEYAYVDYPFGGCTIQVTGSIVRVELPPNRVIVASASVPQYGGFVVPAIAGRQMGRPNTLTTATQFLNFSGGTATFAVPPRARGYRLYTDSVLGLVTRGISVFQQSWQGFAQTIVVDDDSATPGFQGDIVGSFASPGVQLHAQDTSFQDLDPRTELLNLVNLNSTLGQTFSVGVVWQLDLS